MRGSWEIAAHLLPGEDPLARPHLGGEDEELKGIHNYKKTLQELRRCHGGAPHGDHDGGDHPSTEGKGWNKNKGSKGGKQGDEDREG